MVQAEPVVVAGQVELADLMVPVEVVVLAVAVAVVV